MARGDSAVPYQALDHHRGGEDAQRAASGVLLHIQRIGACSALLLLFAFVAPHRYAVALTTDSSREPWGLCDGQSDSRRWCDVRLDKRVRAQALIDRMTLEEKSGLLSNSAAAIPRLGIPAYNWWSEGLHGLARAGVATSFPQVIGLAASFNRSLWRQLGRATGTEARGRNNALDGRLYHGLTLWSPNVNLFRDPRWGRGQETAGEDPLVASAYASSFVGGLQGNEDSEGYLMASACLKHFAAYTAEGYGGDQVRLGYVSRVSAQDMADMELPPFRDGVVQARATGISKHPVSE